jgi:hypothetical protein
MECVASDCIRIVWESFNYGAVFEANSGFLLAAASIGEVAAKPSYPPKTIFSLAPTGTYEPNV